MPVRGVTWIIRPAYEYDLLPLYYPVVARLVGVFCIGCLWRQQDGRNAGGRSQQHIGTCERTHCGCFGARRRPSGRRDDRDGPFA